MAKALGLAAAAILLGIVCGGLYSWREGTAYTPAAIAATAADRSHSPDPPAPQIPAAPRAEAAPESLDASDATIRSAATDLVGQQSATSLLTVDGIVRHIVATVDTLPRQHFAAGAWPLKPLTGGFIATADDQKSPLSEDNFARYTPYIAVLRRLDAQALAKLYLAHRALFQQAYAEVSPAGGDFRSRLLVAIDTVLAAPEANGIIMVARPDAMYQFADPALENLPAGQKLLLRTGPANTGVIKGKLRELRAALSSAGP
ncbi:MAG: DUF3014 domain-containing protein [Gammaproteobacteria bacterium]